MRVVGGAARGARLRDRRRGDQGRPASAVAGAGSRGAGAALGRRLEVPADHRDDEAQPDRLERGADRPAAPVRDAGARPRGRRHGFDRHPAQRGGPGPQGRPRGRRGRGDARRRRDPAGDLAAASATQGQAPAKAEAAGEVPAMRNDDGEARGLGVDDLPEPPRLPGPDLPAGEALPRRAMDIEGLGREERDPLSGRGPDRRSGRHLRPDGGADRRARGIRRDLGPQPDRRDRGARSGAPSASSSTRLGCPGSATSTPRRSPSTSARSTPCSRRTPRTIEEVEGIGPVARRQVQRGALGRGDSGPDPAAPRARPALRALGRRAPRRRVVPWRARRSSSPGTLAEPDPRGGHRTDQARGRQGDRLGLQGHRLRGRRRQPRLEARQGRGARAPPSSTRTGCGSCCRARAGTTAAGTGSQLKFWNRRERAFAS